MPRDWPSFSLVSIPETIPQDVRQEEQEPSLPTRTLASDSEIEMDDPEYQDYEEEPAQVWSDVAFNSEVKRDVDPNQGKYEHVFIFRDTCSLPFVSQFDR